MQTVSIMAKKLLDPDTRKLVKAGLVDNCLNMTSEGKSELLAIQFEAYKKELVARADEIIAEAEKVK